jgi:hypothetical protein
MKCIKTVSIVGTALAALAGLGSACSTPGGYEVTFYGYPDNSPPGPAIAHDCGRGYTAGGMHKNLPSITSRASLGTVTDFSIKVLAPTMIQSPSPLLQAS